MVETIESMYSRLEQIAGTPGLQFDRVTKSWIEVEKPYVKPVPWIERADGTRDNTTRANLIQIIRQLTVARDLAEKSQPFHKARIVIERAF